MQCVKANLHGAICSNNLYHTTDIASCERKNRINLSQGSQRNMVVATCRSYKLSLQIEKCKLASTKLRVNEWSLKAEVKCQELNSMKIAETFSCESQLNRSV